MPPADGSSTRGGSTSVRRRVHSPRMAKLQAASVSITYGSCAPRAAAPWDRETVGVRIAVSLNAPHPTVGHNKAWYIAGYAPGVRHPLHETSLLV